MARLYIGPAESALLEEDNEVLSRRQRRAIARWYWRDKPEIRKQGFTFGAFFRSLNNANR